MSVSIDSTALPLQAATLGYSKLDSLASPADIPVSIVIPFLKKPIFVKLVEPTNYM